MKNSKFIDAFLKYFNASVMPFSVLVAEAIFVGEFMDFQPMGKISKHFLIDIPIFISTWLIFFETVSNNTVNSINFEILKRKLELQHAAIIQEVDFQIKDIDKF